MCLFKKDIIFKPNWNFSWWHKTFSPHKNETEKLKLILCHKSLSSAKCHFPTNFKFHFWPRILFLGYLLHLMWKSLSYLLESRWRCSEKECHTLQHTRAHPANKSVYLSAKGECLQILSRSSVPEKHPHSLQTTEIRSCSQKLQWCNPGINLNHVYLTHRSSSVYFNST